MGSELVSGSLAEEGSESSKTSASRISYTEQFHKHLPYYIAIGMPYNEFWYGDCSLTKCYREAEKIKRRQKNEELWLQGMYVYEAILDASPILHAFAGKNAKPTPYSEKPYPMTAKEIEQQKKEREEKEMKKAKAFFESMVTEINNTKFKAKEEKNDG